MSDTTQTQFPATKIVHWATGPVAACDLHASQLVGLARFLGGHVGVTIASPDQECGNCRNEAAKEPRNV
jgi:hypothetical protein